MERLGVSKEIVLASCDSRYYELYGQSFENSLKKINQPYHIHRCDDNPWMDSSYFACARYLILPEMIEEHGGVFVADIDAVFIRPLPHIHTKIGLVKTSPKLHRSEWEQRGQHLLAGHFYCSDVDIASRIRDRILELPKRWFVDQIAIHEVVKDEKSRTYFSKPPTRMSDALNDTIAIMPRGNKKKLL